MSPELLKKILDAIAAGDDAASAALLPEIVAALAAEESGEPAAPGADPMAAAADAPPADPNAPPKPDQQAASKGVSALAKALGCSSDEEAAEAVVKLQKQVQAQAEATAAVELETRRELIARLVKCGIEKPGVAWVKNAKGEVTNTPVARLMVEPIAELRARVELHEADGPRVIAEPPPSGDEPTIKLSKQEQEYCKKHDMTPEQFAAKKASAARTVRTAVAPATK